MPTSCPLSPPLITPPLLSPPPPTHTHPGKLSNADIGVLTAEADTDDGVIDFDEYLPFAADLMLTVRAREHGTLRSVTFYDVFITNSPLVVQISLF